MSGHFRYEISKSQFGSVRLFRADTGPASIGNEQSVAKALCACLDAKITYKRKGWFGPKKAYLTYQGQTISLEHQQGALGLDLLEVDDEARETILELMRQSPLFIRS